ncbi:hypothetical protein K461DRAFT_321730 [Myriangium duriaei CBS 260.36]|uniref:Rhodopsin domain-containing protein n=1 Tax=Myriangium duriaei CBS 260.36 TaxID=1168546 RepID=A0A9P4J150_9PEZI|nr:hypothetical protein K461DRAFT_321730 [Myriangium duriaei CBS 260.36]
MLAAAWLIALLGVICTVLRYFQASRINGRWRWDFIWAALASLTSLATLVTFTLAVVNGVGNKMENVTYTNVFNSIYYVFLTTYLGLVSITAAKFSVIALILQIEGPLARRRRIILFIMAAVFSIVNFITIPICITQCVPYNRLWYRYLPGTCPRVEFVNKLATFQGYMTSVTDLVLALWPISIVTSLSKPFWVKVKVCALMAVGTLPGIFSIIRTTTIPDSTKNIDVTRAYADFLLYCAFELGFVIVLSSVPVLRPLFHQVWNRLRGNHDIGTARVSHTPAQLLTLTHPENSVKTKTQVTYHVQELTVAGQDHEPIDMRVFVED